MTKTISLINLAKILKKILLLMGASLMLGKPVIACDISEGDLGYYKLFEPQRQHLTQFHGFALYYRTFDETHSMYYTEDALRDADDIAKEMQKTANIISWKYHFGNRISERDIAELLYGDAFKSIVLEGNERFHRHLKPLTIKHSNRLIRKWNEGAYLDELNYLAYAHVCEPHCLQTTEWSKGSKDVNPQVKQLIEDGKLGYASTNVGFLKLRYAYQMVRLAQYQGKYEEAIALFERYAVAVLGASQEIGGWVVGNYAGCLTRTKRPVEAAYAFSRQYAASPSRRMQAQYAWRIRSDREWRQLMRLCKNDVEKADNYALRALSYNSVPYDDMRMMQQLDPGREDLDLILVREINKLEEEMLGPIAFGSVDFENKLRDQRRAPKARKRIAILDDLVMQSIAQKQAYHLPLWQIAHCYLQFLRGEFSAAREGLENLLPSLKGEDLVRGEMLALEMELVTTDRVTRNLENRFAEATLTRKGWNARQRHRFITFRNDALFWKYLDQGDELKATLVKDSWNLLERFGVRSSFVDSVLVFKADSNKTAFEKELETMLTYNLSNERLIDIKGTALLAEGKLNSAIATFESLSHAYRISRSGYYGDLIDPLAIAPDPFRPRIKAQEDAGVPWKSHKFDKLTFAKTLKNLLAQTTIDDGKNAYRYLLIGNAYYNTLTGERAAEAMTFQDDSGWHYGYEKVFLKDYVIEGHCVKLWPRNIDTAPAVSYYHRAIATSEDRELQALAYFMIAQCELLKNHWIRHGEKDFKPLRIAGFEVLRDAYADTEFVSILIQECANFKRYCAN